MNITCYCGCVAIPTIKIECWFIMGTFKCKKCNKFIVFNAHTYTSNLFLHKIERAYLLERE